MLKIGSGSSISNNIEHPAMRDHDFKIGQTFVVIYNITSRDSFKGVQELIENILYVQERADYVGILVGFDSRFQLLTFQQQV